MTRPIAPRPEPPKPEEIEAQYGFVALLARQIPELSALLFKAKSENWTADRFTLSLANTNWWKTTPETDRKWITQKIADPASANADLQTGGWRISSTAAALGFHSNVLNSAKAQEIWLFTRLHNFNEQQTQAHIFSVLRNTADGFKDIDGLYGQNINKARQLSALYGYNPSNLEGQIRDAVDWTMEGGTQGTLSDWESQMKRYAKSKYAAFADQIDAGDTVVDIARPYMEAYRDVLEQDASLYDKNIQSALQGEVKDPKTGPVAQPEWKFREELRKDGRWGYTQNARESTAKVAMTLGKMFGKVGG